VIATLIPHTGSIASDLTPVVRNGPVLRISAMISARIDRATSPGDCAPMSRPTGCAAGFAARRQAQAPRSGPARPVYRRRDAQARAAASPRGRCRAPRPTQVPHGDLVLRSRLSRLSSGRPGLRRRRPTNPSRVPSGSRIAESPACALAGLATRTTVATTNAVRFARGSLTRCSNSTRITPSALPPPARLAPPRPRELRGPASRCPHGQGRPHLCIYSVPP
jgi:hypothetical protein